MDGPEVDEELALDVLRQFAGAVFEKERVSSALLLLTEESRHEWARDWVLGELEAGNDLLSWAEKDDLVLSLSGIDAGHRLWSMFADDTLRLWHDIWRGLPDALDGSGTIHLRRHRTPEEWATTQGYITVTVGGRPRVGPPTFWVYFDAADSGWRIADINA